MYPRRGRRQPGFAMVLLAAQLMRVGFDKIPPVTLATILGQVAVFFRLIRLPGLQAVCISGVNVWYMEEWQRLLMAAFFHANEWHLYFNMVSFLWKGISLERKLGSTYFAYLIAVFALLSNSLTVGLSLLAENATGDPSYLSQCAVGFSGVLFALKVVTTHMMPPGVENIMGLFRVHSRIACWVELLLIHILVPNASFMAHLAGILIGLLYVKGPLKLLMDQLHSPGPSYTYTRGTASARPRANATFNYSGTTGGGNTNGNARYSINDPTANTYSYTAGLSEEEQLRRGTEDSLYSAYTQQSPGPSAPPSEDLPEPTTAPSANPSSRTYQSPTLPPYSGSSPSYIPSPTLPPAYGSTETSYFTNNRDSIDSPNRIYPDLSTVNHEQSANRNTQDLDDLRRRRLAKLEKK